MTEAKGPRVGVGVIIHDNAGNIVMGQRAGSHGAGTHLVPPNFLLPTLYVSTASLKTRHVMNCLGTLQLPGGHQEFGESFAQTATREVLEETGLQVGNVKFLTATNDLFGEGKHYITLFVTCTIVGEEKVPQVRPDLIS